MSNFKIKDADPILAIPKSIQCQDDLMMKDGILLLNTDYSCRLPSEMFIGTTPYINGGDGIVKYGIKYDSEAVLFQSRAAEFCTQGDTGVSVIDQFQTRGCDEHMANVCFTSENDRCNLWLTRRLQDGRPFRQTIHGAYIDHCGGSTNMSCMLFAAYLWLNKYYDTLHLASTDELLPSFLSSSPPPDIHEKICSSKLNLTSTHPLIAAHYRYMCSSRNCKTIINKGVSLDKSVLLATSPGCLPNLISTFTAAINFDPSDFITTLDTSAAFFPSIFVFALVFIITIVFIIFDSK